MNMWDPVVTLLLAVSGAGSDLHESTSSAATTGSALEPAIFIIVSAGMATLIVGMVLCLYRLLRGPHLGDRVLAADALSLQVVGLVILLGIQFHTLIFFDAALVVAIIGFASTLAFAQYIGAQQETRSRVAAEE